MRTSLAALLIVAFCTAAGGAAETRNREGLAIDADNPFYWQYQGKPVLLLGGSSAPKDAPNDEGMFLWPDFKGSLDKLAAAGGNYTRCLMSGRLRGEPLWPFVKVDGQFDLDQFDPKYWEAFEAFLQETKKRRIVTDVELWATFDYARLPWTKNPFNPANNRNYTAAETGLAVEVKSHPCLAENVFYHTLPGDKNIAVVLKSQQRFVDKVLSYSLQFDHVLYCMDNETGGSPAWGAYWARYVRQAAQRAGRQVYLTEMFEPHDLGHPLYRNVLDHPELYDFIEISQNNHQAGQTHFDKIMAMRQSMAARPRPLSNVKIYGSDGGGLFGSSHEATERFWRILFAGGASARFHEKHLGDSALAQRMIRSARDLTGSFDLFHCAPHPELLLDGGPNQAYCLANPGKEYVVYFPTPGRVQLDVRVLAGQVEQRWYDIEHGTWAEPVRVQGQTILELTSPGPGQWAAIVHRVQIRE